MTKATVFGTNCKANTICRVLPYHPKKKSLSEYGDSGKLNSYLAGINKQAQERFERLVEDLI